MPQIATAMAQVLVVGGTGLLGQYLCAEAQRRSHDVTATFRGTAPSTKDIDWRRLDLREVDSIGNLVKEAAPNILLNAAALTDVDGCEDRPDEAETINAIAPETMAEAATSLAIPFVHISTDYVFDGLGPADETTEPHPLGTYGRTKLDGEWRVPLAHPKALVLRLSAVFGWNRLASKRNSVTWILSRFEVGQEVPLFDDQRVTPTFAATAAEAAFDLVDRGASGIFHVACRDCLSRVEMGQAISKSFGLPGARIVPTKMSSLRLKAPRPVSPCLVVTKVEETLKRAMPSFRDCVDDMRRTRQGATAPEP